MTLSALLTIGACAALLQQPTAADSAAPAPGSRMTTYQLVLLKRGPAAETVSTPDGSTTLMAHAKYMYKLAADGISMAAGPLLDGGDIQGLMILNVPTAEKAREIEAADPAVKAGIFVVEVAPFMILGDPFGKWAEMGKFETVYFGFLNRGANRGQDRSTAQRLQAEHLAYMDGQAKEGRLVVAGPFMDDGPRRGIVVYRVADAKEASRRAEGDPMIKIGRLAVELHPWQIPQGALPASAR